MRYTINEIMNKTNPIAKAYGIGRMSLFGSYARGEAKDDSDVDLYIEMEKEEKPFTEGFQFVYDLWTNYTVDKRMYHEIQRKGVLVYERK